MTSESSRPHTVWTKAVEMPMFPALTTSIATDVLIIGAGIAGLSTAYNLTKAGRSVTVIDDGQICSGETERTTAHLSNVIDDGFHHLQKILGTDRVKLAYESHSAAIDWIEKTIQTEGIACDFCRLDGFLFLGHGQSRSILERELKSAQQIGFVTAELLAETPCFSDQSIACIRFPNQAQFHVLKYLKGVASAICQSDARIFSNTHAVQIQESDGKVRVITKQGFTIAANTVVIATNSPISDRLAIHTKQAAYRTYVVAAEVPAGTIPKALYWDTEYPYHYIRTASIDAREEQQLLIIGGEDHRTGQKQHPRAALTKLEHFSRKLFPAINDFEYQWSGQIMETIDGLAFIGHDPGHKQNVFVATGDSGMGMTHGTIAGLLISDLILGHQNPWAEIYNPARKPVSAAISYVAQNANTAVQYADYLRAADVTSVSDIAFGEGATTIWDGQRAAAYRDQAGDITVLSARCPHLGAIVRWNEVEKTWDCPAHGSRFQATGQVIDAPAISDLSPLEHENEAADQAIDSQLPHMPPGDSGIEPPAAPQH